MTQTASSVPTRLAWARQEDTIPSGAGQEHGVGDGRLLSLSARDVKERCGAVCLWNWG